MGVGSWGLSLSVVPALFTVGAMTSDSVSPLQLSMSLLHRTYKSSRNVDQRRPFLQRTLPDPLSLHQQVKFWSGLLRR